LDASLFSISGLVDGVIIADGPYDTYTGNETESGEETYSILSKWKNEFLTCGRSFEIVRTGKMNEIQKRNQIFQYIKDGDIAFVIDGDEIAFTNGLERADFYFLRKSMMDIGFVNVLHLRGAWGYRPRIFRVGRRLRYNKWFDIDLVDGTNINLKTMPTYPNGEVNPPSDQRINTIRLVNLSLMFRSKERDEMGIAIKDALIKRNWK